MPRSIEPSGLAPLPEPGTQPIAQPAPFGAFLALIGANAALAFGAILVRFADTGPVAAAFWRLAIAAPVLVVIAWVASGRDGSRGVRIDRRLVWLIAAGGLFFAADLAAWHLGIVRTKIANATLFGNSASLLLVVWGIFVLRQRASAMQIAGLGLAVLGAALLFGESLEISPVNLRGDLLSLLAGILYTGYILSLQSARSRLGSWQVLAISTLASLAPLLGIALALGEQVMPRDWTPLVTLALTSQVLGQGLLVYALPHFRPLVVGLALLLQPAIAGIAGYFIFDETLSALEITGAVALAAALVLARLQPRGSRR